MTLNRKFFIEFDTKGELPSQHRLSDQTLYGLRCGILSKSRCRHSNSTFFYQIRPQYRVSRVKKVIEL